MKERLSLLKSRMKQISLYLFDVARWVLTWPKVIWLYAGTICLALSWIAISAWDFVVVARVGALLQLLGMGIVFFDLASRFSQIRGQTIGASLSSIIFKLRNSFPRFRRSETRVYARAGSVYASGGVGSATLTAGPAVELTIEQRLKITESEIEKLHKTDAELRSDLENLRQEFANKALHEAALRKSEINQLTALQDRLHTSGLGNTVFGIAATIGGMALSGWADWIAYIFGGRYTSQ
jgi:hypothetical protein